jgi:adenylyltransferase/sulfurtransferase
VILIDRDVIEESNLQRQGLYTEQDVGRVKVVVAKEKLRLINSTAVIEATAVQLDYKNIDLLKECDVVLDCTDNLKTRFLINEYCRREKKRWVYAAAIGTKGYVMSILPEGPCLKCFLSEASLETCEAVGVLNATTYSIAALQVAEVLKLVVGKSEGNKLYYYNVWKPGFQTILVKRKKDCPMCKGKYIYLKVEGNEVIVRFCSTGRYQIQGVRKDLTEMKKRWMKMGKVVDEGEVLHFKNITLFKDGRVLVKANSEEEARGAYSKWVGN